MSVPLLTRNQLLETRREGRRRGYPECCIDYFTGLLECGVLPFQHMGGVIAKRRSRRGGMGRLAECVPCPAHRGVPPPGWAWVPRELDTSAMRAALLRPPEVEPVTTLIAVYDSRGCVGRCDSRCYDAKEQDCDCICGGVNHGQGLAAALRNTVRFLERGAGVGERMRQMGGDHVVLQPELFEAAR